MKKKKISLRIYENFWKEFESMSAKIAGPKGEQVSAGLMAFMAISRINKGLASALTDYDLDSKKAAELILSEMTDADKWTKFSNEVLTGKPYGPAQERSLYEEALIKFAKSFLSQVQEKEKHAGNDQETKKKDNV